MNKNRLEAFSDGVLAVIITVMLLELKPPHGDSLGSLGELAPKFASYALSYVYIAIYWHNHHHLLHATKRVNGTIMWANTVLLFALSLVPFVTGWMAENHFAAGPVAAYGFVLLASAVAYFVLTRCIVRHEGESSKVEQAIGRDTKGKISIVLYASAIPLAFVNRWLSFALYWVVALLWLVPDRRVERVEARAEEHQHDRSSH